MSIRVLPLLLLLLLLWFLFLLLFLLLLLLVLGQPTLHPQHPLRARSTGDWPFRCRPALQPYGGSRMGRGRWRIFVWSVWRESPWSLLWSLLWRGGGGPASGWCRVPCWRPKGVEWVGSREWVGGYLLLPPRVLSHQCRFSRHRALGDPFCDFEHLFEGGGLLLRGRLGRGIWWGVIYLTLWGGRGEGGGGGRFASGSPPGICMR